MPKSDWTEENARYVLCFFPLVGIPIGFLTCLWRRVAGAIGLAGTPLSVAVLLLIPMAVTGGIHLDGLMDTADALHSYQGRERRLEILEDSRSGAFAIIQAAAYFLLYYGIYDRLDALSGDEGERAWKVIALSFVASRALSGYAVAAFQKAKETGYAASFSNAAQKKAVKLAAGAYLAVLALGMAWISVPFALAALAAAGIVFFCYRSMAYRKFGGVTGDLAGWFLQNCELAMAFAVMAADWAI